MMFYHRKLLDDGQGCPKGCKLPGPDHCRPDCQAPPGDDAYPPPPPPIPYPPPSNGHHQTIPTNMITMLCVVGGVSLLGVGFLIFAKYYAAWRDSRRTRRWNSRVLGGTREDFLDENHGPAGEHHIWLINTIGLPQSVIDSITVFKYKKEEGLTEETECSVCLSEFEEDESLRLLPKCNHAFHLPCIDTWLRSHKNCPLCRAPIVSDAVGGHVMEPNSIDSGSFEEPQMQNFENYGGFGSHQVGEGGTSQVRVGAESFGALPIEDGTAAEISSKDSVYFSARSDFRVQSDNLADSPQLIEEETQAVRRSVSMDSFSALKIYQAVANMCPVEYGRSFDSQLGQTKSSKVKIVAKRGGGGGGGNSSINKLMKSPSLSRRSVQKGPISMKRSFSSSGKLFSSKHGKSQSTSVLPL